MYVQKFALKTKRVIYTVMIVQLPDRLQRWFFYYQGFDMKRVTETGRSMIEMLGVLAIVGILSVGGIAGFGKAMTTYRLNKSVEEFVVFIRDLMVYHDSLIEYTNGSSANLGVTSNVVNMGILPDSWTMDKGAIIDSIQHIITVTVHGGGITVNYELKNKNRGKRSSKDVKEYCRLMFLNGAMPYKDIIKSLWIHRYGEGEGSGDAGKFYGSRYCITGKNCLHTAEMAEILRFCETCESYENCTLVFSFD